MTEQSHDEAELRRLPVLLHRAREAFSAQFRDVFLLHDLTDPQWRILLLIQNNPDLDISELARRSFLLGPSLSRILRDLSARGLVLRQADPGDGRRAFHNLTPAGADLIAEVRPYFDPIYSALSEEFVPGQALALNQQLEGLLNTLSAPRARASGL